MGKLEDTLKTLIKNKTETQKKLDQITEKRDNAQLNYELKIEQFLNQLEQKKNEGLMRMEPKYKPGLDELNCQINDLKSKLEQADKVASDIQKEIDRINERNDSFDSKLSDIFN